MKKVFIAIALVCSGLFLTQNLLAEAYYYGFILSCGKVEYYTSDRELSSAELENMTLLLEKRMCAGEEEQFLEDE